MRENVRGGKTTTDNEKEKEQCMGQTAGNKQDTMGKGGQTTERIKKRKGRVTPCLLYVVF